MPRSPLRLGLAWLATASLLGCGSTPEQSDPLATAHLPARVDLEGVPFYPQQQYQCGPAALATVLRASGVQASPDELSSEVYLPSKRGSLQVELIGATRARDRVAYELAPSLPALLEQIASGRPVLVMQNVGLKIRPAWHFAVVTGYDQPARQLILRSGTTRKLVMDVRRFMRTWDRAQRWAIVVLEPEQLPAAPDLERHIAAVASLESVGRLDAAKRAYERAREHWPQSAWPVLGLANISYLQGDARAAEVSYLRAIELEPRNVVALNNLAELLAARGCITSARLSIARAIEFATGTGFEPTVRRTAQHIPAHAPDAGPECPGP